MIQKLQFNKENKHFTLQLNEECPYFKIIRLSFASKDLNAFTENRYRFAIRYSLFRGDSAIGDTISPEFDGNPVETEKIDIPINRVINDGFDLTHNNIKISYGSDEYIGFDFDIYYDTQPLDISLEDPFDSFFEHINDYGNCRILFSAPYGSGKTTFLKKFFNEYDDKFEVINLYPVNYSVAKNEDIFKYIKCGILFQLLGKDVEFKKEEFKYIETLPQFILKNPTKLLAPFIKLLPAIGGSVYDIYEKLSSLIEKYFKLHDETQIDDKGKAIDYIRDIYNEEGSIFEDNFYTQLIRNLIEQLNDKGKQTVLVIDDMDRMDPDHIFRVLNVFAAHFDSEDYDYGKSNKFGFKRIVFVCDINNIKRLFQYRYGDNVDFAGYIDKFFSNSIYMFSNSYAVYHFIENLQNIAPDNFQLKLFLIILQDLFKTGNLSLREILKLKKMDFFAFGVNNVRNSKKQLTSFQNFDVNYFSHIYYLNQIFTIDEVVEKFKNCSDDINEKLTNKDYSRVSIQALSVFTLNVKDDSEVVMYKHKASTITIKAEKFAYPKDGFYYNVISTNNTPALKADDFYLILSEVAKKFSLIGGLEGN